ncbi:MAG: hypothetical protein HC884_12765 [Chloroflexaceae bacterium]|nr:hypothetical protein [Chloroflexaceae bacterium]
MHLAPLDNSVVFKKLFRDPAIVTAFVKDLIGVDLDITADNIELEKQFVPTVGAVDIKIDIFVQDPKHRLVIEIQRQRYDYHADRFLYYHDVAKVELIRSYQDYRFGHTVYTIVWLPRRTHDPFLNHSIVTTSLCSVTEAGKHLNLYPHRLYFLNPFYVNEHTRGVADWLRLAAESITNPQHPTLNLDRPILERATQLIMEDGITPQERAQMFEETGYENHLQRRYTEGKKEGMQAGIQVGKKEGIRDVARAMLAQGMKPPLIAQVTGLTPDEVAELAQDRA